MSRALVVVAALALLAPAAAPAQSVFPSKAEKKMARLLDAEHVSARTRKFLRSKMQHHAKNAQELLLAVALLKYDASKQLAMTVANEPRLDRSAESGDLSDVFFQLEDALRKNVADIADAADKRQPHLMSAALGKTVDGCVSCHAIFRPGASAPQAADAGTK